MLAVVMWYACEREGVLMECCCDDFQSKCEHVKVESEFGRCDAGCAGTMQVRLFRCCKVDCNVDVVQQAVEGVSK
jgi:hypothetical protein